MAASRSFLPISFVFRSKMKSTSCGCCANALIYIMLSDATNDIIQYNS